MAANELDSFVFKLKNLWRNGQEATLNVKTKAGEAWVELQVGLGRPLDLPLPHIHLNQGVQNGKSRDRRRAKRAAERKKLGPNVSEEGTEKDGKFEEEPLECVKSNTENVRNASIKEKKEDSEIAVIPEKETPTDTFENEIDFAEEASNDDKHDAPCENCQNMFNFHNDIQYSMCDTCLFSITKKEGINLPFIY
jgi:hypothetical protein